MKIISGKHLGAFGLIPAAPGTCSEKMKAVWREELRKLGVHI
jgi:hypothetical protein